MTTVFQKHFSVLTIIFTLTIWTGTFGQKIAINPGVDTTDKLKQLMAYHDIYIAIEKGFGITKNGLNKFLREQINLNRK